MAFITPCPFRGCRLRKHGLALAFLALAAASHADIYGVRIAQIYGAGGMAGATYANDYVTLFNYSGSAINLSGSTLQYSVVTGNASWTAFALTGTIPANGFYLVEFASSGAVGLALPTPDDAYTSQQLAKGQGQYAVVPSMVTLTGACGTHIVTDAFGVGGAYCAEGTTATAIADNTHAYTRTVECTDTNNNFSDFSAVLPNPKNSASTVNNCGFTNTPTPTQTFTASPTITQTFTPTLTNTPVPAANKIKIKNQLKSNLGISFLDSIGKRFIGKLIMALLFPADADAAIAVDGSSAVGGANSGLSSISYSYTSGSGTQRILVVSWTVVNTGGTTETATWNGVSLTKLTETVQTVTGVGVENAVTFYMLNPPASTTANVVINYSPSGGSGSGAQGYSGVSPSTPFGTISTAQGALGTTSLSTSITTTAANSWLLSHVGFYPGSHTYDSLLTQRYNSGSSGFIVLDKMADMTSTATGIYTVTNTYSTVSGAVQHYIEMIPYVAPSTRSFKIQNSFFLKLGWLGLFAWPSRAWSISQNQMSEQVFCEGQIFKSKIATAAIDYKLGKITATPTRVVQATPTPDAGKPTPTSTATSTPEAK